MGDAMVSAGRRLRNAGEPDYSACAFGDRGIVLILQIAAGEQSASDRDRKSARVEVIDYVLGTDSTRDYEPHIIDPGCERGDVFRAAKQRRWKQCHKRNAH